MSLYLECDRCLKREKLDGEPDDTTSAIPATRGYRFLDVGDGRPLTTVEPLLKVDLCERCRDGVLDALRTFVKAGQPRAAL